MERTNKKQDILDAALDLFSVNGFEATSIAQIAEAVGIKKASLYFHFESKQDLLDTLTGEIAKEYGEHSLFTSADWENAQFVESFLSNWSPEVMAEQVKKQIRYILHDPHICKVRKMLVLEQFRNEELSGMFSKRNYEDVLHYNNEFMKCLIQKGILKDGDSEIMAAQFCFPISMWLSVCDRQPEREDEIMELLDRHIRQFFEIYMK
ncbi:MAG: helix-turn-helix domain containing protein [bacterium]|nr:helix-turn-helix domain containing protein [bacterium]